MRLDLARYDSGFFIFMKLIPLTKGMFAQVDDEDYEYLMQWKWSAHMTGKIFYSRRVEYKNKKQYCIKMHRFILSMNDAKIVVDHIDHDGLNNQRYNLRKCSISENVRNSRKQLNKTSQYKGVSLDTQKYRGKLYFGWVVKVAGKSFGRFKNEIDAAKVYDIKAKEIFGEYAKLNFPKPH